MLSETEIKKLNQQRFADSAQAYVNSPVHAQGKELTRFIELTQPQPDWQVLDVATGGGHTALVFEPHVARVTAVDLTFAMLTAAHQASDDRAINFSQCDAEKLPFASSSFELVSCRVSAHHFPDAFAFVREAARVLKPNGLLLIQDHIVPDDEQVARYINAYERLRDPGHVRILPEYEWRGNFLDAGLTVEHTEQLIMQHTLLPWAKRQNCSAQTLEYLQLLLLRAAQDVLAWMQPQYAGTEYANYSDHHMIILGRKPLDV